MVCFTFVDFVNSKVPCVAIGPEILLLGGISINGFHKYSDSFQAVFLDLQTCRTIRGSTRVFLFLGRQIEMHLVTYIGNGIFTSIEEIKLF